MRALLFLVVAGCGRLGFSDGAATDAAPDPDARLDAPPDAPAFIAPGIVVRYAMDDDPASGAIGSAELPATCTVCPKSTPGVHGGAYLFDGTVRFELPSSTLVGNAPYTVALWFRLDADPVGGDGRSMVNKYYSDTLTSDVFSLVVRTGNAMTFETTGEVGVTSFLSAPTAVVVGAWHHVAATWDGTTKRLYLDGAQVASIAQAVLDSSAPIGVGADLDYAQNIHPWNGALDELQFYGRALTGDEIALVASP